MKQVESKIRDSPTPLPPPIKGGGDVLIIWILDLCACFGFRASDFEFKV